MSKIQLNIDRLVLNGIDPAESKALVEALRAQLFEMLSDPVARAHMAYARRTPVLRLGWMPIESGTAGARKFGRQMAQAMRRGLKP